MYYYLIQYVDERYKFMAENMPYETMLMLDTAFVTCNANNPHGVSISDCYWKIKTVCHFEVQLCGQKTSGNFSYHQKAS